MENLKASNESPLTFSGVLRSDGTVKIPAEVREFLKESGEAEVLISFKKKVLKDEISDEEIEKISQMQKLEEAHVRVMMESEGVVLKESEPGRKLSELGFLGLD